MIIAQNVTISGFVIAPDRTPVEFANIFDKTEKTGTTTDAKGWFSLQVPMQEIVLRISHVTFSTQTVEITKKDFEQNLMDNAYFLEIVLEPKIETLSMVEISGDKVQVVNEDSKQWILDYELIGEKEILLLLMEKNKRYLQLIDEHDNKVVAKTKVDSKYRRFYRDCFGNIYLLSDDNAFQIFLVDEELILLYEQSMQDFSGLIEKVVLTVPNYFFTKEVSARDKNVVYYQIDTAARQASVFYNVIDEIGKELQKEQIELFREAGGDLTMSVSASSKSSIAKSENRPEQVARMGYLLNEHILSQEPYVPLMRVSNNLYLFDHISDKVLTYHLNGALIKEHPIDYHNNKDWMKNIFSDEEKQRCFTVFSKNGRMTLKEFGPEMESFSRSIVLEKHLYPSKISVRGDKIYYLARDYFENENKYYLWKQIME
jgi:hypothetical protein